MRQKCSGKLFILTISLLFSVSYSVTKIKKKYKNNGDRSQAKGESSTLKTGKSPSGRYTCFSGRIKLTSTQIYHKKRGFKDLQTVCNAYEKFYMNKPIPTRLLDKALRLILQENSFQFKVARRGLDIPVFGILLQLHQ